ncbi:MAG: hypothetical protein CVV64_18665 [Candidatus Wallbacteria bacterium HGW-Wallbacteria-1]|jgi:hypothetical protein|uniref:Uncharacterized protein n=1 Tax=Candidatus Wallbacteria bacterium HGW-Wallbacteria-1 TaxID=2013854 RepID=A0A2N1PJF7_9BACT|nr:MAG: hypothetical protein CVV64_18665 [Candidatus Wallbacteria bacterium HGW-Wallbacteria-1]
MGDYAQFFTKVMEDSDFRDLFISKPLEAFKNFGITDFEGREVKVFQNDLRNLHFVLLEKGADLVGEGEFADMFVKIQKKVWEDVEFRKSLINKPGETLNRIFGPTTENVTFHFHENTPAVCNFVMPFLGDSEELSDCDLEMVAGGKGSVVSAVTDTVTTVVNTGAGAISHANDAVNDAADGFTGWVFDSLKGDVKQIFHVGGALARGGYSIGKTIGSTGKNLFSGW